jgi:hypothetical protein
LTFFQATRTVPENWGVSIMKQVRARTVLATIVLAGLSATATAQSQTTTAPMSAESPTTQPVIPPEMAARYAHAKWTYFTSAQMAEAYPRRAQDEHVQATITTVCNIAADGTLSQCAVPKNARDEYGFTVVTATLFVKYCHVDPATVAGGIQAGDYKVFTLKWTLS